MRFIKGYEGYYALSKCGNQVISLSRTIINKNGTVFCVKERKLKGIKNIKAPNGELYYGLSKNGFIKKFNIYDLRVMAGIDIVNDVTQSITQANYKFKYPELINVE